jgi:hypothetical protein
VIKKIFLGVLLVVTLLIGFAFVAKDYFFKRLLISYVKNTFHGDCRISSTNVSFSSIRINDFSFSNPDCKIGLKRGIVTFAVSWAPLINISSVRLEEGKLTVINLENLKKQFTPSSSQAKTGISPVGISDVLFYLKDIGLEFENINNVRVTSEISLALHVKEGEDFSMGDITISHFNADSDGFTIRATAMHGIATARIKENMLRDIKIDLADNAGGLIHVKNEASLDFLRRYMDEHSFKALVDNFKNYAYNIGTVTVHRQNRDAVVETIFDSPARGHRDIVINFHDLLAPDLSTQKVLEVN